MSKMLVPETEVPKTAGRVVMSEEEVESEKKENLLGAIARGTTDGLHMALNIAAMLISFLALIALLDGILGGFTLTGICRGSLSSLEQIFGAFRPHRVGDRNSVARLRRSSAICWARAWC